MADISKVTLPDKQTYNLKDSRLPDADAGDQDSYLRGDGTWSSVTERQLQAIDTRTYTGIIGTANDWRRASFFFAKINSASYDDIWHVKLRITVTVPGHDEYYAQSVSELWGAKNAIVSYKNQNVFKSTSYRPVYYIVCFEPSELGFENGTRPWIGISLYASTNPVNTSYKRTCTVELLDWDNCTVELQDDVVTPDDIPDRASHTNWYTSTNTSVGSVPFYNNGLQETGDDNTTQPYRLTNYYNQPVANSDVYRYQMCFTMCEGLITPLNNANNNTGVTKTMLTDVEFDPFGRIYYYSTTTTSPGGAPVASSSSLLFMHELADLRYTFNITSGTASEGVAKLTDKQPVYLKVAPLSNGKVKLASAAPLVQELPSTEDGYWYILLGYMYGWYRMSLYLTHPVYCYLNGNIRECKPSIYSQAYVGNGAMIVDLDAGHITAGTLSGDRLPNLDASKIGSGQFAADRIPALGASKITAGTFDAARIPNLDASKIATGSLNASRLPSSGVTAGSYGQTADKTPAVGGTFNVPNFTVDAAGRITGANTRTVTLPTYDTATSSANGLMSATDKSKLDKMTTVPLASGINMTEGTDGLVFTYIS